MKSPLLRLLPLAVLLAPLHAQSDKARHFYDALLHRPAAAKGLTREARLEALAQSLAGRNLPPAWLRRVLTLFGESAQSHPALAPLLK